MAWPNQSSDLNPIEMLWGDLKKAVHLHHPKNLAELKVFSQEEWAKIPAQRCQNLIESYKNRLLSVIEAKGGPTKY